MPQVDFYLLDQHTPQGKLRCVCRLSQKVYALGQTAYVHTCSAAETEHLDELLWTFNQTSFVPHCRDHDFETNVEAPVMIGHQLPPKTCHDVLISLIETIPGCFGGYQRVADVVDNTPDDRARARDRFRAYRDQGWDIHTHDIRV